jgi:hypothetical protein
MKVYHFWILLILLSFLFNIGCLEEKRQDEDLEILPLLQMSGGIISPPRMPGRSLA